MWFSASVIEGAGAARVEVVGEVDLATIVEFRRAVRAAEAAHATVEVDLSGAELIDSLGLGVLVGARRRCVERGGSLVVVDPPAHVVSLLDRSGLASLLGGPS